MYTARCECMYLQSYHMFPLNFDFLGSASHYLSFALLDICDISLVSQNKCIPFLYGTLGLVKVIAGFSNFSVSEFLSEPQSCPGHFRFRFVDSTRTIIQ